jgi:hypothetical protein
MLFVFSKIKGRRVKQVLPRCWYQQGGKIQRKVEGGRI